MNHPLRPAHSAGSGFRASTPEPIRPPDAVVSPAATGLSGLDTEYDQFGRFSAAPAEPAAANLSANENPPVNPAAKYFRAGKATVSELEKEYTRSLIDSYVAEEEGGGVRRFIPAGMTDYQVNQLSDYQYRWAIETERRALERTEAEKPLRATPADANVSDTRVAAAKTLR